MRAPLIDGCVCLCGSAIALVNAPKKYTLNNRKKRKNIKQAATDRYSKFVTNEDKKYSRVSTKSKTRRLSPSIRVYAETNAIMNRVDPCYFCRAQGVFFVQGHEIFYKFEAVETAIKKG